MARPAPSLTQTPCGLTRVFCVSSYFFNIPSELATRYFGERETPLAPPDHPGRADAMQRQQQLPEEQHRKEAPSRRRYREVPLP